MQDLVGPSTSVPKTMSPANVRRSLRLEAQVRHLEASPRSETPVPTIAPSHQDSQPAPRVQKVTWGDATTITPQPPPRVAIKTPPRPHEPVSAQNNVSRKRTTFSTTRGAGSALRGFSTTRNSGTNNRAFSPGFTASSKGTQSYMKEFNHNYATATSKGGHQDPPRPHEPITSRTRSKIPEVAEPIARRTRSRVSATPKEHALLTQSLHIDPAQAAQRKFPAHLLALWCTPPAEMACGVFDPGSGTTLEYRQLRQNPKFKDIWEASYSNELGRLCQGIGKGPNDPKQQRVAGTDTFRLIRLSDIPQARRKEICYSRVVCEIKPQKEDQNCTRITIAGNRIVFPGEVATPTASLKLVNLLLIVFSLVQGPSSALLMSRISTLGRPWSALNMSKLN